MELTRIDNENAEYFSHLCPDEIMADEECVKLGVLDDEGYACSICAVGIHGALAHIRWIATDVDARGQGAATLLLNEVFTLAGELGLEGAEISFPSGNGDLEELLAELEFAVAADTEVYSVPVDELVYGRQIEFMLESYGDENRIKSFPEDDTLRQALISRICSEHDLGPGVFSHISPKYSVFCAENAEVTGAILVSEYGEDDLYVDYLFSGGSPKYVKALICGLYEAIIKNGKTDGRLIFTDRDGRSAALVENLAQTDIEDCRMPGRMHAVKLF